jgi:hypothetical protein
MSWEGVDFKLGEADFFLLEMYKALTPTYKPTQPAFDMSYGSSPSTSVGNLWQPKFYYHVDAFLAATWSISAIIQVRFGKDLYGPLKDWWKGLLPDEQDRREEFQKEFCSNPLWTAFQRHPLTLARHLTVHRKGHPPVFVEVPSLGGGSHRGGPTLSIPSADMWPSPAANDLTAPPALAAPRHEPVIPSQEDFYFTVEVIDGKGPQRPLPLFQTCAEYLQAARDLVKKAREIDARVHAGHRLTPPPRG